MSAYHTLRLWLRSSAVSKLPHEPPAFTATFTTDDDIRMPSNAPINHIAFEEAFAGLISQAVFEA